MSYTIHTHVVLYTRCVCVYISIIHLNSHESMRVNGEALQLHTVYTKPHFYYKSRDK